MINVKSQLSSEWIELLVTYYPAISNHTAIEWIPRELLTYDHKYHYTIPIEHTIDDSGAIAKAVMPFEHKSVDMLKYGVNRGNILRCGYAPEIDTLFVVSR